MGQSKLKLMRRSEREKEIGLVLGKNKKCDELLNSSKVKTKTYTTKESLRIKNDKPDFITFYNGDTGEILYTAKMVDKAPDVSGNI